MKKLLKQSTLNFLLLFCVSGSFVVADETETDKDTDTDSVLIIDDIVSEQSEFNIDPEDLFGKPVEQAVEGRGLDNIVVDSEDIEITFYTGTLAIIDFSTNTLAGLRLGYHINENFFLEGTYGSSKSLESEYLEQGGTASRPLISRNFLTSSERRYSFINFSAAYEFLSELYFAEDLIINSGFYIVGGLGTTRFVERTEPTVHIGAGYRLYLTDSFHLKFDLRDHIFERTLANRFKITHNFELTVGISTLF